MIFITLLATVNSMLGAVEVLFYGRAISRQPINPRPLFVLGHPRTGTTMLHTLLALDRETFGFCSTFCAGFPAAFLLVERFRWLFEGLVDKTRPMDNVEISLDTPQVTPQTAREALGMDRTGMRCNLTGSHPPPRPRKTSSP